MAKKKNLEVAPEVTDHNPRLDMVATLKQLPKLQLAGESEDKLLEMADTLLKYIDTHKWLINQSIPFKITCEQAAFSWLENVYTPIVHELETLGLPTTFYAFSRASDHWWHMLQKDQYITPRQAILDWYLTNPTNSQWKKFWLFFRAQFLA
jgi:hypothetical protein